MLYKKRGQAPFFKKLHVVYAQKKVTFLMMILKIKESLRDKRCNLLGKMHFFLWDCFSPIKMTLQKALLNY